MGNTKKNKRNPWGVGGRAPLGTPPFSSALAPGLVSIVSALQPCRPVSLLCRDLCLDSPRRFLVVFFVVGVLLFACFGTESMPQLRRLLRLCCSCFTEQACSCLTVEGDPGSALSFVLLFCCVVVFVFVLFCLVFPVVVLVFVFFVVWFVSSFLWVVCLVVFGWFSFVSGFVVAFSGVSFYCSSAALSHPVSPFHSFSPSSLY